MAEEDNRYWTSVPVETRGDFEGDLYIETCIRSAEGQEFCIPHTIMAITREVNAILPVINLSETEVQEKHKMPRARGWPCKEDGKKNVEQVLRTGDSSPSPLQQDEITIGPIGEAEKGELMDLINSYRSCFTENNGCV